MTFAGFIEVVVAFLKFPEAVLGVVRMFQKVPEQKHEDLLKEMAEKAKAFEETGRPQ